MKNGIEILGVCLLLSAMAFADTRTINGVQYEQKGDYLQIYNGIVYDVFGNGGSMSIATPMSMAQTGELWTCIGQGAGWRYNGQPDANRQIGGGVFNAHPPAICPTAYFG